MDATFESLDRKDGSNDNKVSVKAVKKQAKKEGYSVVDKKKGMAKKMSKTERMESKGYRYVAPPAPDTAFKKRTPEEQKQHEEYYKIHKGSYVKNKLGKDGKYI